MRPRRVLSIVVLALASQAGCSSADGASNSPSAAGDAQAQDAFPDVATETSVDASVDSPPDSSLPDAPPPDGIPIHEAAPADHLDLDSDPGDGAEAPDVSHDVEQPPHDAGPEPQPEAGPEPQPEAGPEPQPEAGPDAPSWPVQPGFYSYVRIPTYGLANPPAVAWHPSGSYALVLDGYDSVYEFNPTDSSLTKVASAGATLRWRDLTFSPDGSTAILLGNNTSTNEGVLYLWDDASSSMQEMAGQRYAGGTYEALEYSPDGTTARLLGSRKTTGYIATVWTFDITNGRSNPRAQATSAGCQDIAWATDVYGSPALAIVCGVNGVQLMHLDGGNNFILHTLNAGNTSHVAGRPQGDYALGVCWSSSPGKVYHFADGLWNSDYSSPAKLGIYQVEFSSDGLRALLLGGYGGNPAVGQVYEYRHDLLTTADIYDVSIPNFATAPYNADSYVELNDASWRPGCDSGLIVGGSSSYSSTTGYVIRFDLDNGIACPD